MKRLYLDFKTRWTLARQRFLTKDFSSTEKFTKDLSSTQKFLEDVSSTQKFTKDLSSTQKFLEDLQLSESSTSLRPIFFLNGKSWSILGENKRVWLFLNETF